MSDVIRQNNIRHAKGHETSLHDVLSDGIVFRRTRYLSILAPNLLILLGDGGEEGVAAEEGDEPDDGEVVHGLEHVQLQPEEQVQQENGAQSQVESWKKGNGLMSLGFRHGACGS